MSVQEHTEKIKRSNTLYLYKS